MSTLYEQDAAASLALGTRRDQFLARVAIYTTQECSDAAAEAADRDDPVGVAFWEAVRAARSAMDSVVADKPRRAPRMTYMRWLRTQGVDIGGTARTEWFWRCPVCRAWDGPMDAEEAKRAGMDHRFYAHDTTVRSA